MCSRFLFLFYEHGDLDQSFSTGDLWLPGSYQRLGHNMLKKELCHLNNFKNHRKGLGLFLQTP